MVWILVKNALKIKEIDLTVVNWRTISVHDGLSLKEKKGNLPLESNGSINKSNHFNASKEWESIIQIIQRSISVWIFNWLKTFYGGDLNDTNEGQGVFWPYEKARPIRAGLCVASGMFVPDTSPTINCFIQLECFVLDCKWCLYSVEVRGWRGGGMMLR